MHKNISKKLTQRISRRDFFRYMLGFGLATTTIATHGFIEPAFVEYTNTRLYHNNLQDIIRVVQLSDLHLTENSVNSAIPQVVNNADPDLVFLTGDYLNYDSNTSPDYGFVQDFVNKINPSTPIFAVFGNWDSGLEKKLFENTNVVSLRNKREYISLKSNKISITGLDYISPNKELLALKTSNDFNFLLYHSPDLAEEAAKTKNYNLMLAGHTHGGQIRIPFLRLLQDRKGKFPWSGAIATPSKTGVKYQSGLYALEDMQLYVSRGLGESLGFHFRYFCRPELSIFEIGPENRFTPDYPSSR